MKNLGNRNTSDRCAPLLTAFALLTQLSTFNSQLLEATVSWIGGSGYWNTPANWRTGALPGPDDDVVIDQPGDITVTHYYNTRSAKSLQSWKA